MPRFPKFLRLLLIALPAITLSASAQTAGEPVYLNYTYVPQADFGDAAKGSLNYFEANAVTPSINIGEKTIINNAFNYKLQSYDFENVPAGLLPENLHDVRYTLVIRRQFSKNWGLLAAPKVNIRGDFNGSFGMDNLFPGIALLAMHTPDSTQLKWGLGVTYNNDFGKNTVLPAAIVSYTSRKMRINVILPTSGSIVYLQSDKFEYGLSFNLDAAIFALGDSSDGIKYVRTFNAFISPVACFKVYGNFWLNAKCGYAVTRNYDLWDGDFRSHGIMPDTSPDSGIFFGIGLIMRVL